MKQSKVKVIHEIDGSLIEFENKWTLWYHEKNNRNWDKLSYTKIFEIKTIKDLWGVYNNINNFDAQLYFLMKNDIFPLWEDTNNRSGGCWNFVIPRGISKDVWKNLSLLLVGLTINKKNSNDGICGISIHPRREETFIKIWTNKPESNLEEYNIPELKKIKLICDKNYSFKLHACEY